MINHRPAKEMIINDHCQLIIISNQYINHHLMHFLKLKMPMIIKEKYRILSLAIIL